MSDDSASSAAPPPPPSSSPPPPPSDYQAPGYQGDPTGQVPAAAPHSGINIDLSASLVFGLLAVVAIVIALFIEESPGEGIPSVNLWDQLSELWAIVAIVAAVATLIPGLRAMLNLDAKLAWTIGAAGAGYLVLWWVLFILPNINLNVSFLATLAVAAALAAVWTSAGNPYKASVNES
jgi:hypothetical protein